MNDPDRSTEVRTEALLLLIVVVWAANYPVAKFGIQGIDRFVFNGIRYIIATVVLAGLIFARSSWIHVERADWPKLIRAGVAANILYQIAFIIGLSMTTAGSSAVLLATSPLWTIVIHSRMQRARIPPQVWLGMILSLVGIIMMVVVGGERLEVGGRTLFGDLICLGAAFIWALSTNLQTPLLVRYSPLQLALVMVAVGAAGLTLVGIPSALSTSWGTVHWSYYLAAAGSGALSIGIGNVLWSHGVQRLGPGRTSNFSNLVPVLALVISYLMLNESLALVQCVGAAVTIVGVWLARR
jgi:drug/metabolite transporter (DMT)-like permease